MDQAPDARRPVPSVGVVCFRRADVLLVQRGKAPFAGQWSLPGGRIEWGEGAIHAAHRELLEETRCTAEIIGLVDVVDAVMTSATNPDAPPWAHYVLIDYAARWLSGEPQAGDDAREARFFAPEELDALGLWHETRRVIEAARGLAVR